MREIGYLSDSLKESDYYADWQTARIVAMLAAVNSKRGKYEPYKWMRNGAELQRRAKAAAGERQPMTGDQVLARFRQLGVPIVDNRQKKGVADGQHIG